MNQSEKKENSIEKNAKKAESIIKSYSDIFDRYEISTHLDKINKTISVGLAPFSDYFEKVVKGIFPRINELLKSYREAFPIQEKLYDDSVKCGWIVPLSMENENSLGTLNNSDLNKYYLKIYTKEDCKMLFADLEQLKDNLNEDYKKIVIIMIRTLENDISTYPLMVSNLFSLLDYMFIYQIEKGNVRNKNYLKKSSVDSALSEYKEKEYSLVDLIYVSCLRLIKKHIEYSSFEDEPKFNRHSIQHGRYSPSKISFADFIRLANLSSAFSEFNSIYESKDNILL